MYSHQSFPRYIKCVSTRMRERLALGRKVRTQNQGPSQFLSFEELSTALPSGSHQEPWLRNPESWFSSQLSPESLGRFELLM